jgi:hypothetical protein
LVVGFLLSMAVMLLMLASPSWVGLGKVGMVLGKVPSENGFGVMVGDVSKLFADKFHGDVP